MTPVTLMFRILVAECQLQTVLNSFMMSWTTLRVLWFLTSMRSVFTPLEHC